MTVTATQLERLEVQKTRLRELLDKTETISERFSIEKLILDIDSRIINVNAKLVGSMANTYKFAVDWLNKYMKKNNHDKRYQSVYDIIGVSAKAHERIVKIIKEDRNVGRV